VTLVASPTAAAIPIALDEAVRAGRVAPGMNVLLTGFGAGLTWGRPCCAGAGSFSLTGPLAWLCCGFNGASRAPFSLRDGSWRRPRSARSCQ
jgi:hypothetical protein